MIRRLEREELLEVILDGLQAGGWSYIITQSDKLPFKITITSGTETERLVIYIWNVGTGGKTRSEDEYRIQLKGKPPLRTGTSFKTLLLGWFEAGKVFVGFDAYKHREFSGRSPSVQVPKHTVEAAIKNKVAFHTKELKRVEGKEVVVAFQQRYLIPYINDIFPEYHSPSAEGISDEEAQVIERNRLDLPLPDPATEGLPPKRRTALVNMNMKVREGSFGEGVWRIYQGRCVVCGIQAELTEAAHIMPVKDEGSDDVRNGVQMCRNHHKAYDNGLYGIAPDYTLILSQERADKIKRSRLGDGLDAFIQTLRIGEKIILPSDERLNPKPEYLEEACKLRGIELTLGLS